MVTDMKVEIRAPHNGEYFRVNPDPASRDEVVLTRDENGVQYLVVPALVPDLMRLAPDRLERCIVFTAQNESEEIFLWPVAVPVPDDHPAYRAMTEWICIHGMH